MNKRDKKIILQVRKWIIGLFLITAIVNGICIYSNYSFAYFATNKHRMEVVLIEIREFLMDYAAFPWLLDYWHMHGSEMNLTDDNTSDRYKIVNRLMLDNGIGETEMIPISLAESLSTDQQRALAEVCYLQCVNDFDATKGIYELDEMTCGILEENDHFYPIFQGVEEGEATYGGNRYALGEDWPSIVKENDIVAKMYKKGKDRPYYEERKSELRNNEYQIVYVPIVIDGKVVGHMTASQSMKRVRNAIGVNTYIIEIINAVLLLSCGIILMYWISTRILRPLSAVSMHMREYGKSKNSKEMLRKLLEINSDNEIGLLADDCADMIIEAERYALERQKLAAEKERINAEIDVAAKIQMSRLPTDFSMFSGNEVIDLYATMIPAKTVGGDFYDFYFIDDDHLYLAIADVTGKGIPAAMFMMLSKGILRTNVIAGTSPGRILENSNNAICSNNSEQMFISAWVGILEISTGKLIAANAGHERPAVMMPDDTFKLINDKHGLVLGTFSDVKYEEYEIILQPGSKLFIYTDGIVEACDTDKNQFGKDRLLDILHQSRSLSSAQILGIVEKSIDSFVKGAEQFDDMTMLCLEYKEQSKQI